MSVLVVNRLRSSVPIAELAPAVQEYFPPVFDSCDGFERFYFVQVADDEAFAIIVWDTGENARAGADRIGQTLFREHLGPYLIEQDRRVGPAVVSHTKP